MNEKNILVKNSNSGLFWGGPAIGFNACRDKAVAVDKAELAFLRATFLNCVDEEMPSVSAEGRIFLRKYQLGGLLTQNEMRVEMRRAMRGLRWTSPKKADVLQQIDRLVLCRKLRPAAVGPRGARGFEVVA